MATLHSNASEPLLRVKNLSIRLRSSESVFEIQNLSFEIHPEETLTFLGESGSGKTMTALSLLGLLPESAGILGGEFLFLGKRWRCENQQAFESLRGKEIAMIFQEASAALNPAFRVGVQISDVLRVHCKLSRAAAKDRVLELFTWVGFEDPRRVYEAYPHQLSGGMAQRVMIAMALSCQPKLIIADEPTASLDVTLQKQILKLIKRLQHEHGFAFLLITHDIGVAAQIADRIMVLRAGTLVEEGQVHEILASPGEHFTQQLIAASFPMPQVVNVG